MNEVMNEWLINSNILYIYIICNYMYEVKGIKIINKFE